MRRDGTANRERILVAAEQVFGTGGPAASTEEVARRAGVGVATVFRHFPTKGDLLEATSVRYLGTLETEIRRLTGESEPGPALATAMRVLVSTGPTKVTLLTLLLADAGELTDAVTGSVHTIRALVGGLLARAQDAGAARADATTEDVLALTRALAHVTTAGEDPARDRALGIVLDGLAPRGSGLDSSGTK